MPKNRIIIVLGSLIALLPILGFPRIWESFFQIATGLSIVLLSVWTTIDKRLTLKAKAHKRQMHRRRTTDIEGRRASDAETQVMPEQALQEEHL